MHGPQKPRATLRIQVIVRYGRVRKQDHNVYIASWVQRLGTEWRNRTVWEA